MKIEHKEVITVEGKKVLRITTTDERWYQIEGEFWPSVTWIGAYYPKGKRFLRYIADKGWDEAELALQEAAEKGSRVHHACTELLKGKAVKIDAKFPANDGGEPKELTPEEYACVVSFGRFLEDYQPQVLGLDYTVSNKDHKFAGTVDFKCRINADEYKGIWIVDIKTSKDIWPSHEIQVSAYKASDKEVTNVAILQVGYERNKMGYKFTEIQDQFDIFLSVKRIWQKETEGVAPAQKDYPLLVKWNKKTPKKIVVRRKTKKTNEGKVD